MRNNIVVFPYRLLLRDVVRNPDGTLKSGTVVNGGWRFEIRKGEVLCKHSVSNEIVSRYPAVPHQEVEVLADQRGDYNSIIDWAQTQVKGTN